MLYEVITEKFNTYDVPYLILHSKNDLAPASNDYLHVITSYSIHYTKLYDDTAGIDDVGDLGQLRINKSLAVIKQVDYAILVTTNNQFDSFEHQSYNFV